jgi:hypothetical protein
MKLTKNGITFNVDHPSEIARLKKQGYAVPVESAPLGTPAADSDVSIAAGDPPLQKTAEVMVPATNVPIATVYKMCELAKVDPSGLDMSTAADPSNPTVAEFKAAIKVAQKAKVK